MLEDYPKCKCCGAPILTPSAPLAYLAGDGLLNVDKCREFLKTKEKK